MSLERPLLDQEGSSEISEDLNYEAKSLFEHVHNGLSSRIFSPLILIGLGASILILGFQSALLWKLWHSQGHTEVLGEVNGLVPPGRCYGAKTRRCDCLRLYHSWNPACAFYAESRLRPLER
jgi:hypothetical protein